jgi:hypothetical protein
MYQITDGLSHEDMDQFIKSSTYKRIFEHLFCGSSLEAKRKKWEKLCNNCFDRFSTDSTKNSFVWHKYLSTIAPGLKLVPSYGI